MTWSLFTSYSVAWVQVLLTFPFQQFQIAECKPCPIVLHFMLFCVWCIHSWFEVGICCHDFQIKRALRYLFALLADPSQGRVFDVGIRDGEQLLWLIILWCKQIEGFKERMGNTPSLQDIESLEVVGDVWFGKNVVLQVGKDNSQLNSVYVNAGNYLQLNNETLECITLHGHCKNLAFIWMDTLIRTATIFLTP